MRLQLSVLAYNLGNLWRRLVLPRKIDAWSLTSLQQCLVKTGGRRSSYQGQVEHVFLPRRRSSEPEQKINPAAGNTGKQKIRCGRLCSASVPPPKDYECDTNIQ